MSYFKKTGDFLKNTANSAGKKWKNSSTLTKVCIIGPTTAVAATVAAPLLILPALSAAGFTSTGVAAGSIAASVQTAATASGSFFALFQSAAATGAIAASTSVGVGLTAGTTAAGATVLVCRNSSPNPNNDEQGQTATLNDDGPNNVEKGQVETANIDESDNNGQGPLEIEESVAVPEENSQSLSFLNSDMFIPNINSSTTLNHVQSVL